MCMIISNKSASGESTADFTKLPWQRLDFTQNVFLRGFIPPHNDSFASYDQLEASYNYENIAEGHVREGLDRSVCCRQKEIY